MLHQERGLSTNICDDSTDLTFSNNNNNIITNLHDAQVNECEYGCVFFPSHINLTCKFVAPTLVIVSMFDIRHVFVSILTRY